MFHLQLPSASSSGANVVAQPTGAQQQVVYQQLPDGNIQMYQLPAGYMPVIMAPNAATPGQTPQAMPLPQSQTYIEPENMPMSGPNAELQVINTALPLSESSAILQGQEVQHVLENEITVQAPPSSPNTFDANVVDQQQGQVSLDPHLKPESSPCHAAAPAPATSVATEEPTSSILPPPVSPAVSCSSTLSPVLSDHFMYHANLQYSATSSSLPYARSTPNFELSSPPVHHSDYVQSHHGVRRGSLNSCPLSTNMLQDLVNRRGSLDFVDCTEEYQISRRPQVRRQLSTGTVPEEVFTFDKLPYPFSQLFGCGTPNFFNNQSWVKRHINYGMICSLCLALRSFLLYFFRLL